MPRNPDLTDAQLAFLRESFEQLLDGWRSDFRIPWHKTHGDLVNQLTAMIWAMHRSGALTVQEPPKGRSGAFREEPPPSPPQSLACGD